MAQDLCDALPLTPWLHSTLDFTSNLLSSHRGFLPLSKFPQNVSDLAGSGGLPFLLPTDFQITGSIQPEIQDPTLHNQTNVYTFLFCLGLLSWQALQHTEETRKWQVPPMEDVAALTQQGGKEKWLNVLSLVPTEILKHQ